MNSAASSTSKTQASPVWRWLALIALVANAVGSFLSERLNANVPSIAEISARYPALFTPAGYAFSIWGLIYLATIAYAVYALRPSQRHNRVHEPLARLLVAYSVLGLAWSEIFRREAIGTSVAVIVGMFVVGAWMFGLAKQAVWSGRLRPLAAAPFALYFGWISVATLAATATWIKSQDGFTTFAGEAGWTVVLIAAATARGIIISGRYRDLIYPGTIAWALLAIWVAQREQADAMPQIGYAALAGAVALLGWIVVESAVLRHHPLPHGHHA